MALLGRCCTQNFGFWQLRRISPTRWAPRRLGGWGWGLSVVLQGALTVCGAPSNCAWCAFDSTERHARAGAECTGGARLLLSGSRRRGRVSLSGGQPPLTATNRQLPTTSRHHPPTANRHQPWLSYTQSFCKTAVQEHFFFPLKDPPAKKEGSIAEVDNNISPSIIRERCDWRLAAVGGWRLVAVDGWRLVVP